MEDNQEGKKCVKVLISDVTRSSLKQYLKGILNFLFANSGYQNLDFSVQLGTLHPRLPNTIIILTQEIYGRQQYNALRMVESP